MKKTEEAGHIQTSHAQCNPAFSSIEEKLAQLAETGCTMATHTENAFSVDGDSVLIGSPLVEQAQNILMEILTQLSPWRKGPFSICGVEIDAEWRSEKKWHRIAELMNMDELCKDKNILDIGCNNGYFSFKMLAHSPRMVLAIDPLQRYSYYFRLYSTLLSTLPVSTLPLYFEPWGIENVSVCAQSIDTAFCMGILYHRRNPLKALESLREALCPKGHLVVESICLPHKEDICLFPQKTYQRGKGYWFIPSRSVLCSWLSRSGFEVLAVSDLTKTTEEEQRRTAWCSSYSLMDFLSPYDSFKTVEGYPAPYRVVCIARKK